MHSTIVAGAFALLASFTQVSAHGYISSITANGQQYSGFLNDKERNEFPSQVIGWSITNPSNVPAAQAAQGYTDYSSPDYACGPSATNAPIAAEASAGSKVDLKWSGTYGQGWPHSIGIVMNYMANCGDDCSKADKTQLKWFKVEQQGFQDGKWAMSQLQSQDSTWHAPIPSDLASGNYVLRSEIVNLDVAKPNPGVNYPGPQSYVGCVNLKVTGGGNSNPDGVVASNLMSSNNDLSANLNIYEASPTFQLPGPAVETGGASSNKNTVNTNNVNANANTNGNAVNNNNPPAGASGSNGPSAPVPTSFITATASAGAAAGAVQYSTSTDASGNIYVYGTSTVVEDVTTTVFQKRSIQTPMAKRVHRHLGMHLARQAGKAE
ncbi:MAG: hypothetical protein Q9160_004304 [Pyrenula sp. 1 TL-2023]